MAMVMGVEILDSGNDWHATLCRVEDGGNLHLSMAGSAQQVFII